MSTMAYMGVVTSSWTVLPLIIPLYLVRCTANNSVYALQAAITMDYVPKHARGKWNRCCDFQVSITFLTYAPMAASRSMWQFMSPLCQHQASSPPRG